MLAPATVRDLPELNAPGVSALLKQHAAGDNSAAYLLWALSVYVMGRKGYAQAGSIAGDERSAAVGG